MSEHKVSVSLQQRIITKFLTAEGVQPPENLQRLEKHFRDSYLSRTRVFKYCKTFREGRAWRTRRTTSINPSSMECANMLIRMGGSPGELNEELVK